MFLELVSGTNMNLPDIRRVPGQLPTSIPRNSSTPNPGEDIQIIPLDDINQGQYDGWSKGKRNFTRVALKVINKVYEDKETEIKNLLENGSKELDQEESESPREPKDKHTDESSEDTHSVKDNTERRKSVAENLPKRKRTVSTATILGVEAFKKLYRSKLNAVTNESKTHAPVIPQEISYEDEVPQFPRFGSTLSTEAQFALLKCYEDKLLTRLESAYPDKRKSLVRVRSPPVGRTVVAPGGATTTAPPGSLCGSSDPNYRPHSERKRRLLVNEQAGVNYSRQHRIHSPEPELHLHRQVITGQVEKAMDLLDRLRLSNGEQIAYPRKKANQAEPVTVYNRWTRGWAKQFKMDQPRQ